MRTDHDKQRMQTIGWFCFLLAAICVLIMLLMGETSPFTTLIMLGTWAVCGFFAGLVFMIASARIPGTSTPIHKTEHPCHVCQGQVFIWGRMTYPVFQPEREYKAQRLVMVARRCEKCGNVQLFS